MLPLIVALILPWLIPVPQDTVVQDTAEAATGHRIALSFTQDSRTPPTQEKLDLAAEMGISLLHFTNPDRFEGISLDRFHLLYELPMRYTAAYQFRSDSAAIYQNTFRKVKSVLQIYPDHIAAIGLFHFPNELNHQFSFHAAQLIEALQQDIDTPLFYHSVYSSSRRVPAGIDFTVNTVAEVSEKPLPNAIYFTPTRKVSESFMNLEQLFIQTLPYRNSLIILPADWFFDHLAEIEDFHIIVPEYLDGNHIPFPIPHEGEQAPAMNWNVIFLFLILGSFLLHMRYQPLYLQALPRYFFNHSFFVIDIMEHRIRNLFPGIIILLQHAFVTGLILYLSADNLFGRHSLDSLAYHFPGLFWSGNHYISLFIFGFVLAVVLQVISVLWLHLLNSQLKHFSQTLNLYSWPLHLNFLVATILIVFHGQNPSDNWTFILLSLYAFIWMMSFTMAAFDGARFLDRLKLLYILLTVGIHILLFSFLAWLLLNSPSIYEPFQMALSFP